MLFHQTIVLDADWDQIDIPTSLQFFCCFKDQGQQPCLREPPYTCSAPAPLQKKPQMGPLVDQPEDIRAESRKISSISTQGAFNKESSVPSKDSPRWPEIEVHTSCKKDWTEAMVKEDLQEIIRGLYLLSALFLSRAGFTDPS